MNHTTVDETMSEMECLADGFCPECLHIFEHNKGLNFEMDYGFKTDFKVEVSVSFECPNCDHYVDYIRYKQHTKSKKSSKK